MRLRIIVLLLLLCTAIAAPAQSGADIGIEVPAFPEMVLVPGYPVYYAPQLNANYFYYDGLYWVLVGDDWYSSAWYNGPWEPVAPEDVPLYLLNIPVRYYLLPPAYFRGWKPDAPPRWGEHWGHEWQRRRNGWDKSDRRNVPTPAPLPDYQRSYSGNRYPPVEQQPTVHSQNFHYRPQDPAVRERYERQRTPAATPAKPGRAHGQENKQDGDRDKERDKADEHREHVR